jgi:hypothetical protein
MATLAQAGKRPCPDNLTVQILALTGGTSTGGPRHFPLIRPSTSACRPVTVSQLLGLYLSGIDVPAACRNESMSWRQTYAGLTQLMIAPSETTYVGSISICYHSTYIGADDRD